MYGRGLFFAAVHYAQTSHVGFPGGWKAGGIIGLAFAGGSLLPLLFFAPLLWRRSVLLAGGIVIPGALLLTFRLCDNLGLTVTPLALMKHWEFLIQAVLLTAGGLHLLLLVVAETRRRRDAVTIILVLWTIGVIYFATVLNWIVNVRSFLPVVPAAAILLVRRLGATRENPVAGGWLLWPLIPAAAITLSIAITDYQLANSARTAAEQVTSKYKSSGHQLWFEGHGAFQYYMEKLGGLPIDVERSLLQPGDTVVVPATGTYITLPLGGVGWVEHLQYAPSAWMNLIGGTENGVAGFYGANWGPVPFIFGKLPEQLYFVLKVFSRVQWNSQPTNPREVRAGDVPSFSGISFQAENAMTFASQPEVMNQVQLGTQLATEGKIEEAIQRYRNALSMDSNNAVALNNLAWILATTDKPKLRNVEEAVQFATRAVKQTDYRQPFCMEALAAAYAQAGQFPQACEMAQAAGVLAWITGQEEIAAHDRKMLRLYSSGKTVDATNTP
jgi:tetratricopeptide (TPR) repeat protein